jgi:plasmid segregation protein ParM
VDVVGGDFGRSLIKVYTGTKYIHLPAFVGEWREMNLVSTNGKMNYEVEFEGEMFFTGKLAQNESEFSRQMLTEDKANADTKLLALVALHQTGFTDIDLVTGLPISIHDADHKRSLQKLLLGTNDITVNGVTKTITVHRVRIGVEGGGAFWSNPKDGLVRIIDGGSKTINYISLRDRKYIDKDSGTLPFGFDTTKSANLQQMANRIAGELGKKWNSTDKVYTVGGQAENLAYYLQDYYPSISVLYPEGTIFKANEEIDLNLFANAIGYYNMGVTVTDG